MAGGSSLRMNLELLRPFRVKLSWEYGPCFCGGVAVQRHPGWPHTVYCFERLPGRSCPSPARSRFSFSIRRSISDSLLVFIGEKYTSTVSDITIVLSDTVEVAT